ncbi:MAG: hypothetical protein AB7O26_09810 [Planctomycetaceae bacterium]
MLGEIIHRMKSDAQRSAPLSHFGGTIRVAACTAFLLTIVSPSLAHAQARSNKNVRTWAWADEIVQPKTNAITRPTKKGLSSREVARQLLLAARKAAEGGKLDVAEQLALRAEAMHNSNLAGGSEGWDPTEQTPNSFLRQLQAARARQLPEKAANPAATLRAPQKLADADSTVPQENGIAPPPPELSDAEEEGLPQSIATSRGRTPNNRTFDGEPKFGWSAKPDVDFPRPPAITADLDETGEADEDPVAISRPSRHLDDAHPARVTVPQPRAGRSKNSTGKARTTFDDESEASDETAVAASPRPAAPVTTERIIQIRDPDEDAPQSRFADALIQLLSTTAGLVLGILLLVGARHIIKKKFNADFGFVFRVEHVATGEDGQPLAYPYYPSLMPGMPQLESIPMPTVGPGRNGVAAVLTELPSGFQGDELSPYEEEMQKKEEAENEMMKMVLQQNLSLRQQINSRKGSAA